MSFRQYLKENRDILWAHRKRRPQKYLGLLLYNACQQAGRKRFPTVFLPTQGFRGAHIRSVFYLGHTDPQLAKSSIVIDTYLRMPVSNQPTIDRIEILARRNLYHPSSAKPIEQYALIQTSPQDARSNYLLRPKPAQGPTSLMLGYKFFSDLPDIISLATLQEPWDSLSI